MAEEDDRELVEVGQFGRPHGVKGEMRLFIDEGEGIVEQGTRLTVEFRRGQRRELAVTNIRYTPKFAIVELDSVDGRDDAELLRNLDVMMDYEDLPPLGEGTFYHLDLHGMEVFALPERIDRPEIEPGPSLEELARELSEEELRDLEEGRMDLSEIEQEAEPAEVPDEIEVEDDELTRLGTVKRLFETGANDVMVVDLEDGDELFVPMIESVIAVIEEDIGEIFLYALEHWAPE